jgi:hypothetical protein
MQHMTYRAALGMGPLPPWRVRVAYGAPDENGEQLVAVVTDPGAEPGLSLRIDEGGVLHIGAP